MLKYKFIVNPVSLKGKHRRLLEKLKRRLAENSIDFSFEYTTLENTAEIIARKSAANGYGIVVACGGDGTIREVADGIYKSKSILAILPFGTSNDFAKHLGIGNLEKAAWKLFNGRLKKISVGMVELNSGGGRKKMIFCSTSGIGFDARLLKLNHSSSFLKLKKVLGGIAYPVAGLFILPSYRSNEAEIKFGTKTVKSRLFMLNANFVKSMSGMKVTPHADVDSSSFSIFFAEDISTLKKLAGFVWYSITPNKINIKGVHHMSEKDSNKFMISSVKSFSVESKTPIEVQLNGDFAGYTPAKFYIVPGALKILI